MKNKLTLFFLLFIAGVIILASCKKDKPYSNQKDIDLITARSWHNTFRGYDYNNDGKLDLSMTENSIAEVACVLDDNYTFKTDSTYRNDGYGNVDGDGCGVGAYTSSWSLAANGKDWNFDGQNGKIEILNDSTLQFYIIYNNEKSYYIFKR